MNKSVKRTSCLILGAMMLSSFAACGGGSGSGDQKYDPETEALVLASDALDKNFNPFFATSLPDNKIIAMTQVSMLSADKDGNPICGENEPTVALDYNVSMKLEDGITETQKASEAAFTDYQFIIKNGMKFSNGSDLTIKDVLFNLYVYLDPMYMGSSTIYSTEIVGLKSYRAQDNSMEEANEAEIQALFTDKAKKRVQDILDYCDDPALYDLTEQIKSDIALVDKLFQEEISTDWTNSQGQLEGYEDEYSFTEDWQVYLYNENLVKIETVQGTPVKDDNGKYVTNLNSLDKDGDGNYEVDMDEPINEYMYKALSEDKIQAYMSEKGCDEKTAKTELAKEAAMHLVYVAYADLENYDGYNDILRYWMTGMNALEEFAAQEKSEYYANQVSEKIESISGITTSKTDVDFDGKSLGAEHDVLNIRIYKVDPKAIWNFAFTVAPMYYYSNQDAIDNTPYGVKFGDYEFFTEVLKANDKNGLPVGAGVYQATTQSGGTPDRYSFCENNWVYFKRNDYFETMGAGISNAKIRLLRYKVVESDKIITALEAGEIDYGEPSASVENYNKVNGISTLLSKRYQTNGYGYVGINPKNVPDLEVRRAIMKALDPSSAIDIYYGGEAVGLAEPIYRSMSTTSWVYDYAYDGGATRHETIEFCNDKDEILELVAEAGWLPGSDGKLYKEGKPLKLVFTIAGATDDHPAYTMFQNAAEFLNECGFSISVVNDVSALVKLQSGSLEVWAAAWSSTIDPDMYQVYHKDSQATSVLNWGYDAIKNDLSGKYTREMGIINELSDLIDQGRETLTEEERAPIYEKALDKLMELAVEFPTYQRCDLCVLNKEKIKLSTINQNPSANSGIIDRIWEIDYN